MKTKLFQFSFVAIAWLQLFAVASAADYREVVAALRPVIEHERDDKQISAISLALVDDQQLVWADGFGYADPEKQIPATAETVYRVGSVSKLFTDLAMMRLAEAGKLDLDAPVTKYLDDFQPRNPFEKPITLRLLTAHRAGLVREPPVGNYFVPDEPSLEATVRSLNDTELVYEPGFKTKYSNAGIAVVGRVLEKTQQESFSKHVQQAVLHPLGMNQSAFEPKPELRDALARGYMWTYEGRQFEAPTFQLGMAPAGSMYSTVTDLARFLHVLFAEGRGPKGPVVQPETLQAMWKVQYPPPGTRGGFGIGFFVSDFEGQRRVGHDGAVYGFSTTLQALPEAKLGVVAVATKDFANSVVDRIAEHALRLLLAARERRALPAYERTQPIASKWLEKLPGRYGHGSQIVELLTEKNQLYLIASNSEYRARVRWQNDALVVDDLLGFGRRLKPVGDRLLADGIALERRQRPAPPSVPDRWRDLVGFYGWDHDLLEIRVNREGRLEAVIEWFAVYPLEETGPDAFVFPSWGMYDAEALKFMRDASNKVTAVKAAEVVFVRRS